MTYITDLPKEVLLLLGDYLGPVASSNLKVTCKFFYEIFSAPSFWRRYANLYRQDSLPIVFPEKFTWESFLHETERVKESWYDVEKLKEAHVRSFHYAYIDAIRLTKNGRFCLTGSRDRTLAVWNVQTLLKNNDVTAVAYRTNAHNGWIWDICERDNIVYSGSWDKTICVWDMSNSFSHLKTFTCEHTVLSLTLTPNYILGAGLYNGNVRLFDVKSYQSVESIHCHGKAISCLVSNGNNFYSGSEDRKIGFFDFRSIKTHCEKLPIEGVPLSMSMYSGVLYVTDSIGRLYLFDTKCFRLVASYKLNESATKPQISGVCHRKTLISASFMNGFVKLYTTAHPPKEVWSHKCDSDPVSLDFKNDILAIGKANSAFEILTHNSHSILA